MEEKKEVKIIKPGETESGIVTGGVSRPKLKFWKDWSSRKKKIVLVTTITAVVVTLFVIGLLNIALSHDDNSGNEIVACSNKQLRLAKEAIDNNSTDKLNNIVKDIQSNKKYKDDPNCMYVVTKYYAEKGDVNNMNSSINSFYKVYDANKGLNTALSPQSSSGVKSLSDAVKQKNEQNDGVYSEIQSQL